VTREGPVSPSDFDEPAFREAALRCLDGLYGFALSLSRDPSVAEDLVQETYVRALAARRKAAPQESLKAWLFVILHNVWRNQVRRRRPTDDPEALLEFADTREGPEQALEHKRLRAHLRAAIAHLPDSFRQVVVLRCVEGFSYQEVADIVGCPTGTVMSRLARGRALLRESLRPALVDAPRREGIS
jgi:RNA polymerase sigma-70 factor (ECF subfamily)